MLSRYADPQTDLAHSSLWALHRLSTRGLGRVSLCVHVVSPAYGSYSWLSKLDFFWGGIWRAGPPGAGFNLGSAQCGVQTLHASKSSFRYEFHLDRGTPWSGVCGETVS